MKADDHTGNSWMTAFDDQAIQLLGQEAGEVQKMKEASETVCPAQPPMAQPAAINALSQSRCSSCAWCGQDPEALNKYNAIFDDVNGRDYVFRLAMK